MVGSCPSGELLWWGVAQVESAPVGAVLETYISPSPSTPGDQILTASGSGASSVSATAASATSVSS